MHDDVNAVQGVLPGMLGNALDGFGGYRLAHALRHAPPRLVRHFVHIAVRTRQVAPAMHLQDELPERDRPVARLPDGRHVEIEQRPGSGMARYRAGITPTMLPAPADRSGSPGKQTGVHVEHERQAGGERGQQRRLRQQVDRERESRPGVRQRFGCGRDLVAVRLYRHAWLPADQEAVCLAESGHPRVAQFPVPVRLEKAHVQHAAASGRVYFPGFLLDADFG